MEAIDRTRMSIGAQPAPKRTEPTGEAQRDGGFAQELAGQQRPDPLAAVADRLRADAAATAEPRAAFDPGVDPTVLAHAAAAAASAAAAGAVRSSISAVAGPGVPTPDFEL